MTERYLRPDAFIEAGLNLSTIADVVHDQQRLLHDIMSRYDGCWGNDECGQAFAAHLTARTSDIARAMANAGSGIDDLGRRTARAGQDLAEAADLATRNQRRASEALAWKPGRRI
jgi:hypothetical protein